MNLAALEELNQENLDWTTHRLLQELSLFQRELVRLEARNPQATTGSLNRRYDILWSRLAQSDQGTVGERLGSYDKTEHTLARLFKEVRDAEDAIVSISPDDTDTLRMLQERFLPFEAEVVDFNRRVFLGEELRVAKVRSDINRSALFTGLAAGAAFLTIGLALFLVNREARLNQKMAEDNLALAREAEEAAHAKSRFLTMMSHELRTPMNGVLGMLALAKQKGLPENQLRLINQAEMSGQQMIAMLSDILDYSALQDRRMELEQKPFQPKQLADAIHGLFSAIARREGIDFSVTCLSGCPSFIVGDFKRLRQVVAHFASYIVETAGTDEIEIDINHKDDNLLVSISFDYGGLLSGDTTWHPEILLGTRKDTEDEFATDALGPAVARGVLKEMGGAIKLDHPDNERIAILINLPAEVIDLSVVNVIIDTRSEALRTICKVALENDFTTIIHEDSSAPVHKVLIESGSHDEAERVSQMSKRYPGALLVALGKPINPAEFDGWVSIPLDITALRKSVNGQ